MAQNSISCQYTCLFTSIAAQSMTHCQTCLHLAFYKAAYPHCTMPLIDEQESEIVTPRSSKPLTIHTIECNKEECYQKALTKAAKLLNSCQDVPHVLYPDHTIQLMHRQLPLSYLLATYWICGQEVHTTLQMMQ